MNGVSLSPVKTILWVSGLLVALCANAPGVAAEQVVRDLHFDELSIENARDDRWTSVQFPGGQVDVPLGAPALPSARVRLPIGPGQALTGVTLDVLDVEVIELDRPVQPYAGEMSSLDLVPPTAEPDASLYAAEVTYPAEQAELVGTVSLSNGERFAIARIMPVQVLSEGRKLIWAKQVRVTFTIADEGAQVGELVRQRPKRFDAPLGDGASLRGQIMRAEPGFLPEDNPSVDGSAVEYVIISPTNAAMMQEWQRLADWKTACGIPAVVVTTDWINENYSGGSDLSERIRYFLRDSYLNWDLKWALIGGDVSLIPTRFARSWAFNGASEEGTDVACDYYYSCLDGAWDEDEDGVFGESNRYDNIGDEVDFSPEIQVGRVSARDADDIHAFLEKYFVYVGEVPNGPDGDGYLDKILFLGEVLFHKRWDLHGLNGGPDCGSGEDCVEELCRVHGETNSQGQYTESTVCVSYDGASDCFRLEDVLIDLNSNLEMNFMLERAYYWIVERADLDPPPVVENYDNVLAALSDGYGCIHHVGHGDRDRWAIGDGRFLSTNLSEITNGNAGEMGHFYWVYGTNCNSAAIDYDCFGEQFLLLPGHGTVAYIGCTNVDYPTTARAFSESFYRYALGSPGATIGDGFFGSAAENAPLPSQINTESSRRFLMYTLTLLGDPNMAIWQGTPGDMSVAFDTAPTEGIGTLAVTVSDGSPVSSAKVCVHKEGEVYVVGQTDATGVVDLPFWPETEGEFEVTVTSPFHRPEQATGTVTPNTGAAIVFGDITIIDNNEDNGSDGNGDGALDPAEVANLQFTVSNMGGASASNVRVEISATGDTPAGVVTLGSTVWTIGTLDAAAQATSTNELQLTVATALEESLFGGGDQIGVPLEILVAYDGNSFSTVHEFHVVRPRLELAVNEWPIYTGTTRQVLIGLTNTGKGTASNLKAVLTANNSHVAVDEPTLYPEDIAPGATAQIGPYDLTVTNDSFAEMTFNIYDWVVSQGTPLHTRVVDVGFPSAPDSLGIIGLPDGMILGWSEGVDVGTTTVTGYRLYRAPEGSGTFTEVHGGILSDHRILTDHGLENLALYRYQIRSVDVGGNLGAASPTMAAYTSPGMAEGWPNFYQTGYKASPLICELDNISSWYDDHALREIIFPGERLYAYHGNGSEMTDGDGVASTSGPFSASGANFYGKAAAGDLNGDGTVEVVAISTSDKTVYCWDIYGDEPTWSFTYAVTFAWASPVLADLDNNGTLEIIFVGGAGGSEGIFVLSHDGTPFKPGGSPPGRLTNFGDTYNYHAPAVGDVNGDGYADIILGTRNRGLHVVNGRDGNYIQNFQGGITFEDLGYETTCRAPVTLANVDHDPGDEMFIMTRHRLFSVDKNALRRWEIAHSEPYPSTSSWDVYPEAVIGDVNGDGFENVVWVDAGGRLNVVRAREGITISHFPLNLPAETLQRFGSCILANVDSSPEPEIVFGDNQNQIHAYTHDGTIARGFPIQFSGTMDAKSLAAWDVDDDGYQNLVVQAENVQKLGVFDLDSVIFNRDENPWPMRRRDNFNTGHYDSDNVPVPVVLYIEQAVVDPSGSVRVTWLSGEPVSSFNIYRSAAGEGDPELAGAVEGQAGDGIRQYEFVDVPVEAGVYTYEINPVSYDGIETRGVRFTLEVGSLEVSRLALRRISPNPLSTGRPGVIEFSVPGTGSEAAPVELRVFDLQGRVVRTLIRGEAVAGGHSVEWDGRDGSGRILPSGLYVIRLESGVRAENARVLMVR